MTGDHKKPNAAKRAFYRVFNDKSSARRIAFSGLIAAVPAVGVYEITTNEPSTEPKSPTAQVQYQAYKKEISDFRAAIPAETVAYRAKHGQITREQSAQLTDVKAKAQDFSVRLALDNQLSEAQIRDISYSYITEVGKVIPLELVNRTAYASGYLDETKAGRASQVTFTDDTQKAKSVVYSAAEWQQLNVLWSLMAFMLSFEVLGGYAKRSLQHGRRRDDEFIEEQKREEFDAARRQLEDVLKPKGPRPPKP